MFYGTTVAQLVEGKPVVRLLSSLERHGLGPSEGKQDAKTVGTGLIHIYQIFPKIFHVANFLCTILACLNALTAMGHAKLTVQHSRLPLYH